jgi:hypothetical protein
VLGLPKWANHSIYDAEMCRNVMEGRKLNALVPREDLGTETDFREKCRRPSDRSKVGIVTAVSRRINSSFCNSSR